jgi:sugar lactone lactonase YvrE
MRLRTMGAVVASVAVAVVAVAVAGASGVSRAGTITTIAGTGKVGFSGDGGTAIRARLFGPAGVAVDGKGNLYIGDLGNNRVRKVSPGGTITRIAGSCVTVCPSAGDGGPATKAQFSTPTYVAVDGKGNVYVSDGAAGNVRKVSPGGTITRFAGGGSALGPSWGDGGPATGATLVAPTGLAVDGQGNVYIAEHNSYARVRKVSPGGTITTVAGTTAGFSGDGGPAIRAQLSDPEGLAVDGKGNLYIADGGNNRVRKVSASGTITTIAGSTGKGGFSGDGGPATKAKLYFPRGVAVDGQGNVYIVDYYNSRVRKVSPGGTITTSAGSAKPFYPPFDRFSGDGRPATKAKLSPHYGVAVDGRGNIYIADTGNHRVRKVWK